ncbi:hypothetical protein Tco_0930224 [Tanacetum coccineum]
MLRIVCNPDLMDIMLLRWFFDAASLWNFRDSTLLLLVQGFTVSIHWYVVPTGKDNVIVSAGRSKVIPAGLKIYLGLDLHVVCENESDNSKENSDKSLVKEQVSQDKSSFVGGYGSNTSEVEPKKVRKNDGAPIIEDWVSDDEEQDGSKPKSEKKTVIPTDAKKEFAKLENIENPFKKSVRVKGVNVVKSSAYWVWRPTKSNDASLAFKRHNYIDARGRSKASHTMMIKDLLTVDAQGT